MKNFVFDLGQNEQKMSLLYFIIIVDFFSSLPSEESDNHLEEEDN